MPLLNEILWLGACFALISALALLPMVMRKFGCCAKSAPAEDAGAEGAGGAPEAESSNGGQPGETLPAPPPQGRAADETWRFPARAVYQAFVLVVEDNKVIQLVTKTYLEQLGHRVDCVSNGLEAVAAVENLQYDLILMDLAMPELDGYGATARIREMEATTGKHVPIIAFTAHSHEGDRDKCLSSGMDDYLQKPVGKEELGKVVERFLTRKQPPVSEAVN